MFKTFLTAISLAFAVLKATKLLLFLGSLPQILKVFHHFLFVDLHVEVTLAVIHWKVFPVLFLELWSAWLSFILKQLVIHLCLEHKFSYIVWACALSSSKFLIFIDSECSQGCLYNLFYINTKTLITLYAFAIDWTSWVCVSTWKWVFLV